MDVSSPPSGKKSPQNEPLESEIALPTLSKTIHKNVSENVNIVLKNPKSAQNPPIDPGGGRGPSKTREGLPSEGQGPPKDFLANFPPRNVANKDFSSIRGTENRFATSHVTPENVGHSMTNFENPENVNLEPIVSKNNDFEPGKIEKNIDQISNLGNFPRNSNLVSSDQPFRPFLRPSGNFETIRPRNIGQFERFFKNMPNRPLPPRNIRPLMLEILIQE